MSVEFRELRSADELAVLPEFEKRIWGGESEMVSVNVLVATVSEGGMAIGAFEPGSGRIVGAVYGFATSDPHVLHSHYMAVDPEYRRRGLAVELKQRQRVWCIAHGLTHMRWTYDPLQLANAHLNLHVLGTVGVSYHVDHYGTLGGINGELPTDRVTVSWDLTGERAAGRESRLVEVPPYTADDIVASTPAATAARMQLREALVPAFAEDWQLTDIDRRARTYTLTR